MDPTYDVRMADLQEQQAGVVCGRIKMEGIPEFLGGAFTEVMQAAGEQHLDVTGPPFARYRFGAEGCAPGEMDIEAGFPLSSAVEPIGRVEALTLPGGHVVTTMHRGAYAGLKAAYEATLDFATDEGYEPADAPWESYLDEPGVPEPRTEVFLPCRPVGPHTADDD